MEDCVDRAEFFKRIEPYNTPDKTDKALYNFALNKMMETPTADVVGREKIDKAIAEIEQAICSYGFCFVSRGMNLALDILKKNIGENK